MGGGLGNHVGGGIGAGLGAAVGAGVGSNTQGGSKQTTTKSAIGAGIGSVVGKAIIGGDTGVQLVAQSAAVLALRLKKRNKISEMKNKRLQALILLVEGFAFYVGYKVSFGLQQFSHLIHRKYLNDMF